MTMEEWRPIPGYEGLYEVSSTGRVYSVPRRRSDGPFRKGRVLRLGRSHKGYLKVDLFDGEGGRSSTRVHRLVALAFLGPAPASYMVRHLNGLRDDNRLSNLAWGTGVDNSRDCIEDGTHPQASRTHCKNGHPYAGANLRVDRNGHRQCLTCKRASRAATSLPRDN